MGEFPLKAYDEIRRDQTHSWHDWSARRAIAVLVLFFAASSLACRDAACTEVGSPGTRSTGSDAGADRPSGASEAPIREAREFYQRRPSFQRPFAYTQVPEGLPDLSAETCGECHVEIYREWRLSTHRRAWTDPQFQAELQKSRGDQSGTEGEGSGANTGTDDVGWMCVNCHAPLKNQMPRLVVGLRDGNIGAPRYVENPHYSEQLRRQGITCASCHVRNGTVYGPWGDTDAPHPTAKDPDLRSEDVCVQCHQAEARWPSRNLACFFSTGEEWRRSEYAEQDRYCQTCHMPTVERRLITGSSTPVRETRRHWFGGSLIPKRPSHEEELEPLRQVYGSGAKIEVVGADAQPPAQGRKRPRVGVLEDGDCPAANEEACTDVWIRVTNAYAGHRLPTGDPERHIDISGRALAGETEVASVEQRIASKYQWWPDIVLRYDNRLAPGEQMSIRLAIPTSALPTTLKVVADKYRMYPGAFRHHGLTENYVRGRRFHTSTWRVDSKGRPSLETIRDDWGERERLVPEQKRNEPTE